MDLGIIYPEEMTDSLISEKNCMQETIEGQIWWCVHIYNPSYTGGREQKDHKLEASQGKS
jgi:hypothetical protein